MANNPMATVGDNNQQQLHQQQHHFRHYHVRQRSTSQNGMMFLEEANARTKVLEDEVAISCATPDLRAIPVAAQQVSPSSSLLLPTEAFSTARLASLPSHRNLFICSRPTKVEGEGVGTPEGIAFNLFLPAGAIHPS